MLGAAGTALYLMGSQPGAAGVVQQVQPVTLVYPFFALWLAVMYVARRQWRAVCPQRLSEFTAARWGLFLVPLLVVVINLFSQRPALPQSVAHLISLIALAGLVGFVEEGLYWGLFMKWLLPRGVMTAVLVSSVAFALTHALNLLGGQSVAATAMQIVFSLLFGTVAALLRLRAGSLLPLMLWHATFDLVSFLGTARHENPRVVGFEHRCIGYLRRGAVL
ncbi:CPBP family intramembrane glutamic endopeptidase [Deinococcus frigens]